MGKQHKVTYINCKNYVNVSPGLPYSKTPGTFLSNNRIRTRSLNLLEEQT